MKLKISKSFYFECAHTLDREQKTSMRIHGHSFLAQVEIEGFVDSASGMVVDFSILEKHCMDCKNTLDHVYLNDFFDFIPTMENLAAYIYEFMKRRNLPISAVSVYRDSNREKVTIG